MRVYMIILLGLAILPALTVADAPISKPRITAGFSEAEITLNENLTLSDIEAIPRAPGSEIRVSEDGLSVTVQIPDEQVKELIDQGAQVKVIRNFLFVEGSNSASAQGSASQTNVPTSTAYAYGENYTDMFIPGEATWAYSDIAISGGPPSSTVTSVDIFYRIYPSWFGSHLYADLTDDNWQSYSYVLMEDYTHTGSVIVDWWTISAFNGRPVNQTWILWAAETYSDGLTDTGHIDEWWIKVYYDAGPSTVFIRGYVTTDNGYDLADVNVSADGGYSDVTDSNGFYEIQVDAPYTGSVIPDKTDWIFAPTSYDYVSLSSDIGSQNFVGTYTGGPSSVFIRGYVTTNSGYDLRDVDISATGSYSDITDGNGFYEIEVDAPYDGSVTAEKTYWDFPLGSHVYSGLSSDINDQNFVGTYTAEPYPTISGYVKTAGGEPVRYVHLAADNFGGSTMTDADGYYELTVPIIDYAIPTPWSGTVEPGKTDWSFAPPNNVYTDLAFDISDQNYIAQYVGAGCENGWVEEWATVYKDNPQHPLSEQVYGIVVDEDGYIYATGRGMGQGTGWDIITTKYDPNGQIVWSDRFNGPANDHDEAIGVLLDDFGNVYVVGRSDVITGSIDHADCVTIKYSKDNNEPAWVAFYDGSNRLYDTAAGAAVDPQGNIYVLCRGYSDDIITIKYSSDSNEPDWVSIYDGPGYAEDTPQSIVCDDFGNIYVIGYSYTPASLCEWVTLKYSQNSNVPVWTNIYSYQPDSEDTPGTVDVDEQGNVYTTGISVPSGADAQMVAIIYDPEGNEIFHERYLNPFNGYAGGIAFDKKGSLYASGSFEDVATQADCGLVKYNMDSNEPLWTARYNGSASLDDFAWHYSFDEWGNIYIAATTNYIPQSFPDPAQGDIAVLKYAPDSNEPLWVANYSDPLNVMEWPDQVAVDKANNVYLGGSSLGGFLLVKYRQCCKSADINCDFDVDPDDLGYLCDYWLYETTLLDIAPPGGDEYVDFLDWAAFASSWASMQGELNYNPRCDVAPNGGDGKIDHYDAAAFATEWLRRGDEHLWADIYPQPDGDGVVDIHDYALLAAQWMSK